MKRRGALFLAGLAMALAFTCPATAQEKLVLHTLGAETAPGTGTAFSVGLARGLAVQARITAGTGTVNPFDVWLECSLDGTNFSECALDGRVKATGTGAGPHTDNTIKLIAEVAVQTSGVYLGSVTSLTQFVRARWNIAGTTPSETFEVIAFPK
jgi:hypothetical protein